MNLGFHNININTDRLFFFRLDWIFLFVDGDNNFKNICAVKLICSLGRKHVI